MVYRITNINHISLLSLVEFSSDFTYLTAYTIMQTLTHTYINYKLYIKISHVNVCHFILIQSECKIKKGGCQSGQQQRQQITIKNDFG